MRAQSVSTEQNHNSLLPIFVALFVIHYVPFCAYIASFFSVFFLARTFVTCFLEKQYFVLLVMYFVKHQQLNK